MKLGIYLFINGEKTAVNEWQYAQAKREYLEKGYKFTEDKGVFHKWLYITFDGDGKQQRRPHGPFERAHPARPSPDRSAHDISRPSSKARPRSL